MQPAPTPHDSLFKSVLSDPQHAAGELRHVLPAAASARIDWSTLALCPGSFVDEAFKHRHCDLLFSANAFSANAAGTPVFLYLLFEHQSTPDELMAFRLLRYMLRIWEADLAARPEAKRLRLILPLVLHHSDTGWTHGTAFEDLLDADAELLAAVGDHTPRFRFLLDDISFASDDALRARATSALVRLTLFCMRHSREPDELAGRLRSMWDLVREVRRAPNGMAALQRIWRYIWRVTKPDRREQVLERLKLTAGESEMQEITSVYDEFFEEGRQTGVRATLRGTLLKQLAVRFGPLPSDAIATIEAADADQLDQWLDRVLTAPSLADVLRED